MPNPVQNPNQILFRGATEILPAQTAVGPGAWFSTAQFIQETFQAILAGVGALTATILIEASNDGSTPVTLGTITLSGNTLVTDGFASAAPWANIRANVTAITGTEANVRVVAGL